LRRFKVHHRIPFLDRLYRDRDRARAERDRYYAELMARGDGHQAELSAERDRYKAELSEEVARHGPDRDALQQELAQARFDLQASRVHHRPVEAISAAGTVSGTVEPPNDAAIVGRIINAYQAAVKTPLGSSNSFWLTSIADIRRTEHETLMSSDFASVQSMLRHPLSNNLCYGFDILVKNKPIGQGWIDNQVRSCFDALLRLAEAVGTAALNYPEAPPRADIPAVEDLLSGLDSVFGFKIKFPNPYPGEVGLATSRGVASYRAIQAICQAWILAKAVPAGRVLEIGGGLGRTAYFAREFGIRDYTIIDLPLTGVAQAYFLSRVGVHVRLYQEPHANGVQIMPPAVFFESCDRFDLVLNVDSFTEMAEETARDYFYEAARRSRLLLSINHEYNPHRVFNIIRDHTGVASSTREPYWLRRGYVHELVTFKCPKSSRANT
jgi:SAM-dependent methyltransferase